MSFHVEKPMRLFNQPCCYSPTKEAGNTKIWCSISSVLCVPRVQVLVNFLSLSESKIDLSVSRKIWLVIVAAVIAPFTFKAVRPMSINGSIDISNATSVTGSPIVGRTIKAANVAPPPTPATPIELNVTMPTSVAIQTGSRDRKSVV